MSSEWVLVASVIGVAFFAISGTLMGYEKKVDGIGIIVLASVTAMGGGTLRDLLLGQPVFWIEQSVYLYATYLSIFLSIMFIRVMAKIPEVIFLTVDAIGLGLFNIVGIETALSADTTTITAVTMGVMTAVFGGLLRDVICGEIPLFMRGELYATACIAGGVIYTGLLTLGTAADLCLVLAVFTTVGLRLAAIKWGWAPKLYRKKHKS